ncbi:MAG: S1 family peptidase [Bdellovibrionota bacterium]
MRILFLAILFPHFAFAIQGGELVEKDSPIAASTVSLQFQMGTPDQWWHHCTAALIAEDLAVTAAHCVPEANAVRPLRLAFTTDTGSSDFPTRAVTSFVRDAQFQDNVLREADDHDLALVRFSGGLPSGAKPARLLPTPFAAGAAVIVAGFGAVSFDQYELGILRSAKVIVAQPLLGRAETLLDQRSRGGTCPGDSGGPAFVENQGELFLWGIASRLWPLRVSDCAQYSIYTRLDAYADWLAWAASQLRKN